MGIKIGDGSQANGAIKVLTSSRPLIIIMPAGLIGCGRKSSLYARPLFQYKYILSSFVVVLKKTVMLC
jgi:hypothetical protein